MQSISPNADLFIIIPKERSWVRAMYHGSREHVNQLRQELTAATERDQQLQGMLGDIRKDAMQASLDRCRLQRELWSAERG